jgi:hypothetical protein
VERPGADSEEKHEPVSDIDTAVVDSLKALDLERPIREAVVMCVAEQVRVSLTQTGVRQSRWQKNRRCKSSARKGIANRLGPE